MSFIPRHVPFEFLMPILVRIRNSCDSTHNNCQNSHAGNQEGNLVS